MEERLPLVSTVTLAWNRVDDVRESLTRISRSTYPRVEMIVCDNGSTDGTAEMVRAEFPQAVLIETGANIGIEAYNLGFKAAKGEYVVILDDDSFPAPDAIARMVEKFAADPRLGIAAFDVRNYFSYDEVAKDVAPAAGATGENYLMGFNGAGAGARKSVLAEAGWYPGEFFLYWNEQDLALRVLKLGYAVKFFPDLVSYHKYSPKNRSSERAPFFYCRNAFWLVWKNYPFARAAALTLYLCRLVAEQTVVQRTTVYLKAAFHALFGVRAIAGKRSPVSPELAGNFRAPLALSFTFFR